MAREYLPASGGLAYPGQAPKTFMQVRFDSKPLAPPHITKPVMYGFNIYISVAIWLGGKEGGFPLNLELAWARGAPKFGPPSPLRSLWVPGVIIK